MNIRHKAAVAGLTIALSMGAFTLPAFATPTQSDLAAAQEKLNSLGSELSALQDSLSEQEADLQKTQSEIIAKQGEIESTSANLDAARATLGDRMRSTYKTGGISFLSMVLGSSSPEDLISNIYIADKIAQQDAEAISSVQQLETQLTAEKTELEQKEATQSANLEETRLQTEEYTAKVDEAQSYYNTLDAEVQAAIQAQAAAEQAAAQAAAAGEVERSGQTTVVEAISNVDNSESEATATESTTSNAESESTSETSSSDESSSSSSSGSGGHAASGGGVSTASSLIGSPYVYGAAGPDSFDCSGLVCYCYGYERGRTTYDMIASLQESGDWHTDESELNYGDLVFTHEGHVGIYTGNHTMIDAPQPGQTVTQRTIYCTIYGGGPY